MALNKLLSPSGLKGNNLLLLIGGGAVAFAIYTFLARGKLPASTPVVKKQPGTGVKGLGQIVSGTDGLGGQYNYALGKGYYPKISSFHGKAYATTTTPPTLAELKNKILQNIINNAESVTSVLTNLETVKAEIETYTSKLELVIAERTAGRVTQAQIDMYLNEIVKAIAEKLQITLKSNQFPGSTGSNPWEVPDYYEDYYKQYMEYMKKLYENYYKYYQPSYQYYPGSQYNYYQPYQYQYPYPYYPANQYGGQSSYGFSQGYNPYAYGYGGYNPYGQQYQYQYGGGQMAGGPQYNFF